MSATVFGVPVFFGVPEYPVTEDLLIMPEGADVVRFRLRFDPEEFATAVLIRRCGETLFTEKWFLLKRPDGRFECHILAEAGGRYNEEFKDILAASHIQTIRRGGFPLDQNILIFHKGRWCIRAVTLAPDNTYYIFSGRLSEKEANDLPWCHLPEPVDCEEPEPKQPEK